MPRLSWLVLLGACHAAAAPARAVLPSSTRGACTDAQPRPLEVMASTKPVAKVSVTGSASWMYDVRSRVQTRAGQALDRELLEADIGRLWELGIASQIDARVTETAAGPEVELALAPPLRIERVVGADHPALALLRHLEGSLYEPARLVVLAELGERRLKAAGYLRARVNVTAAVTCGRATVTFDVHTGQRYKFAGVTVEGSALPVGRTFGRSLGDMNVVGGTFDYEVLASDGMGLLQMHHDQGWIAASAKDPILTYDDTHGLVSVRLEYTPGPRYRFGTLSVVGGSDRARARVQELVRPLQGAIYDGDAYRALEKRLGDDLEALGFDVTATPTLDDAKIDVVFALREEAR